MVVGEVEVEAEATAANLYTANRYNMERVDSMDLRVTFNDVADRYDTLRPTYLPELYADIMKYNGIGKDSRVLEIGIGTGQATLPILKTGCRLTAIELGNDLAAIAKSKFSDYANFEILNMAFEDFEYSNDTFDLIYSASAFHWIPEEIGYSKVFSLLKSGGAFARFANHPHADKGNEPLTNAIQEQYKKYYRPDKKIPREFDEEMNKEYAGKAAKYGFNDISCKLYKRIRPCNAEGYAALISTYSDHRALGEERLSLLSTAVKDAINKFGGTINLYDTQSLQLARKP